MTDKIKMFQKPVWIILGVQAAVIVFVLLFFKIEDVTLWKGDIYSFNENWSLLREDGTVSVIEELPYHEESAAGEMIALENIIPEKYAGMTLSFLTDNTSLTVYVDDRRIYDFGQNDDRLFGHTPGSLLNFVDIPEDIGQGRIRIEMQSPYDDYAADINTMMIARRDIAILHYLEVHMGNIWCNVIFLLTGVILASLALAGKYSGQGTDGMEYLSVVSVPACIYYAAETKFMHIFYGNQTFYSVLAFLILMSVPMFLILYYAKRLPQSIGKGDVLLLFCGGVNVVLQLTLQILNIRDFQEMAWISRCVIFATGIWLIGKIYHFMKGSSDWGNRLEFLAFSAMVAGGFTDCIKDYFLLGKDSVRFGRNGAVVFCVLMIILHNRKNMHRYMDSLTENAGLLQREVEQMEKQNYMLTQAKEEAERAKQEAEEANEAKSNFLAHMSHEIRTPINTILGMGTIILKETEETSTAEYAMDIQNASQNLLALINDILDFSKIESNKLEILPVEYEVSSLLNDAYHMVVMRAKEKNLQLCVENSPEIPDRLYGDELRIRQIMINLLTNAVKYTEEGRITLRAAAEKTGEEQILFKLEIEDTGAGIKQEDLQKLFESFTRIDEKQNRNIEGTGLGLSITKRLLDLMHGTISVESEYGKGSIFRVEIPQKVLSWEAMGPFRAGFTTQTKVKTDEEEESLWLPEARILVVDDVPMNIKVFTLLLKDTGMQIDTALSGEECLKMTAQKQYNMIFLDHMMPEMDGIEVLHRIQQNEENKNREVPIIALTANAIVGVREKYLKEGFWDYLSKPVKLSGLKKMLLKYLQPELAKIPTASVKAEQKTDGEKTFLEQLDFLDVQKGLSYCADDEDFYKEMLKMYSDNSRLIELKKQYDEKDWENYRIQVHALKSTSLSIGAVKLSEQAKEMEEAAKNGCVEELSEQQEKMMKEYEKLLGRLKEVL